MTKAILPSTFDLQKHINTYNPEEYGIKKFDIDHAAFILSQVFEIPAKNKLISDQISIKNDYTLVSSKILQGYVHSYKRYIVYFIQTNVIECDNLYKPSSIYPGAEKCYGYRFVKEYNDNDVITFNYNKKFSTVVKKQEYKRNLSSFKEYNYLTKWLKDSGLEIDISKALEYIEVKKNAQLINPDLLDTKRNNLSGRDEKKNPIEQFRSAKINLIKISSNNLDYVIDDTVKRMHTPYTNLNSELRNYITFKGERLCSIDIVNSQPYISTVLFNINNISKINKKLTLTNQLPPLVLEKTIELSNNEDVRAFGDIVSSINGSNQDLYTLMLTKSKDIGIGYLSRSEAKEAMFEVLFSSNRYVSDTKKLFGQLFPSVDEIYRLIKNEHKSKLACVLQNIESYMVIQNITKSAAKAYPTMPLITIHDSIATTLSYECKLKNIMYDKLTDLVGLPPKLKTDYWSPENIDWQMYDAYKA